MKYIFILLAAALWSCGHKVHDHEHEGHDHTAGQTHGHEGHNHEENEGEESGHDDGIVFTRAQAEAAGLTVETVEPGEFRRIIKTGGRIEIPQGGEAVIAATSGGMVSFAGVALTDGAAVAKGQILVTISAQGIVEGDPAARARIEFETAERAYRRAEGLAADRIISQKDLDEARRRYETARAALPGGAAKNGVRIGSPIGGYIKNRFVEQGEYVSVGQPLATVAADNKLQLRAEVSERWFGALSAITGANFKTPYDQTVHHAGKVLSYGRSAEGSYVPVIFEFANTGGVMPGSFAEVWLLGRPERDVLSVPKSALVEQQGLYFVYLRHGEEDYVRREVACGDDDGERVRILKGLEPGDRVVTRGVTQVRLAAVSGVIPEGHTH